MVLFYFFTFTPKCFALAVAAVSAKLRAMLRNKICKILQFLCCLLILHTTAISAHNSACTESRNSEIPNYRPRCFFAVQFVETNKTSIFINLFTHAPTRLEKKQKLQKCMTQKTLFNW